MLYCYVLYIFVLFFPYIFTDDIDDSIIINSGIPKFPSFESPKVITLFSSPKSISPLDSSLFKESISSEDPCKNLYSQDKQAPILFIVPSSDSILSTKPISPKSTVTATVTSAFQMENFLQSLAAIIASGKFSVTPSFSSQMPPSFSTRSCPFCKSSSSIPVHRITSTILLTSTICPTQILPTTTSILPGWESLSSNTTFTNAATVSFPQIIFPTPSSQPLFPASYPTISHITSSAIPLTKHSSLVMPNSSAAITTYSDVINRQDMAFMISIPGCNGQSIIIQVPKAAPCPTFSYPNKLGS